MISSKQKQELTYTGVLIAVLSLVGGYPEIFGTGPSGHHLMRQIDSLSFIRFYHLTGAAFWEPGVFNLFSNQGKTASEFPIFYYIIAQLSHSLNTQEYLLRLINYAFFAVGIFHIWKLVRVYNHKPLRAFFISCASSFVPVYMYYGNNFLPDIVAVSCAIAGLFYAHQTIRCNEANIHIAIAWFGFAALIKISYIIYLFAFGGALVIQRLTIVEIHKQLNSRVIFHALMWILSVVCWSTYVKWYNQINHGYFLSNTKPIWQLNADGIYQVIQHAAGWWRGWHFPTIHVFLLMYAAYLYYKLRAAFSITFHSWIILMACGCISFMLLFFIQFRDHDYYYLTFLPLLIMLLIYTYTYISIRIDNEWHFTLVANVMLIFIVSYLAQSAYTKTKLMKDRYEFDANTVLANKLKKSEILLNEAGIPKTSKMIWITDLGYTTSGYYTGRFGWHITGINEEQITNLNFAISKGATHIMLYDRSYADIQQIAKNLDSLVYSHPNYDIYTIKK